MARGSIWHRKNIEEIFLKNQVKMCFDMIKLEVFWEKKYTSFKAVNLVSSCRTINNKKKPTNFLNGA